MDTVQGLWAFIWWGYLLTVALELPVLWIGLAPRHPGRRRVLAALWLTACSYPIVVLVLPIALTGWTREAYLLVAETFAPLCECAVFWAAFPPDATPTSAQKPTWIRDGLAIVLANLTSFSLGEAMYGFGWLPVPWVR